ncbi:DUF945 family protein [Enterovibrio nigricans]|uniref:Uncharacterized conserved protein YdgA, DUF945 family n=1 Tax=Enterovibrio nigricans DSM 22720 TaxID=1121868 RepID=A0A1T4VI07_9GAMM|nr:DUF945 family protein [Enterovibrio nigricans]PKF49737.1 DUF945 domain-containing protein [Enterovibrio nigricans]SKA64600.1 Uncharacterized conserved protein YdgA, DUF945 family [Enterovibrio nigricans DSM 22720]
MIFGKYAAIGGAVSLALIWPFASGHVGESVYDREVQNLQSPYVSIEKVTYDRGYLSSQVKTLVNLKGQIKDDFEAEGLPTTYIFDSEVSHGFLSLGTTTTLEMTPEIKAVTDLLWPMGESPVEFKTETSVFGDTEYSANLKAIKASDDDFSLTTTPLAMAGTVDKDGNNVFSMSWPSVDMASDDSGEKLSIKDVTGTGTGYMLDGEVWIGKQTFNVATALFDDALGTVITLNNISADMGSNVSADTEKSADADSENVRRLDNKSLVSVGKLTVSDVFTIDNFKLGVSINDLDYHSILSLSTMSNTMGDEPTDQEIADMAAALDTLVERGLGLEIQPLELDAPEGHVDASFDLTLAPGAANATQDIGAMINKLTGNLNITVPSAYVEAAPQLAPMINNLEEYGFISQGNEGVKLSAKIEGEEAVSPSGERMPLGFLMMMFM